MIRNEESIRVAYLLPTGSDAKKRFYAHFWTTTGFSGALTLVGEYLLNVYIHGYHSQNYLNIPYDVCDPNYVLYDLTNLLYWEGILPAPAKMKVPF